MTSTTATKNSKNDLSKPKKELEKGSSQELKQKTSTSDNKEIIIYDRASKDLNKFYKSGSKQIGNVKKFIRNIHALYGQDKTLQGKKANGKKSKRFGTYRLIYNM